MVGRPGRRELALREPPAREARRGKPGAREARGRENLPPATARAYTRRMRAWGLTLAAGVASLAFAGGAQAGEAFRKGPYLQNVSRNSVTVLWEVSEPCAGEVRLHEHQQPPRIIPAEGASDNVYELVIDGLTPGRRYRYEVACGSEVEQGEFATAPVPGMPFSFVVFGDSRSNAGAHRMVVERIRREVPDFLIGTGDMVDDGSQERQWQEFFDIERDLLRENVLFPAVGNHDRQGRGRTADNFRKYFALPENSLDPERYYAFTYGSARFLVLDSNAYSFSLTDQTLWIERELQSARLDPRVEHVFVIMHHPPFSVSLHGGQTDLRERWTPLFEKYHVTAVFSGHDHVYSRAEHEGVRYFVTGGAGAPVYPRARRPSPIDVAAVQYFERVHHYVRVQVIGRFVEVSAVRVDGSIIETVSWGTPPRADEEPAVAARSAIPAAGGSAASSGAEPATGATGSSASDSGLGLLGKLGACMMLLAGGVLVWTLRS
jgi:predicted phosphodiesterase